MNVFVIRFSSLGDCVLLCPMLDALKRGGAKITVVTKREYTELFAAARGVDGVIAFDPASGLRGLSRIAADHRGGDAVIIDAHNNWRSRFLSHRLGGARVRIRKYYRERIGLIVFKKRTKLPTILEQYRRLAAACGVSIDALAPGGIEPGAKIQERMDAELAPEGRRLVAVSPGSRWEMKQWGTQNYLTLCRRLMEIHGVGVVLVGDRRDRAVTKKIAGALGPDCVDMAGRASIVETAACIRRCVALIGNDSGLMHLAEAVGVPVIALFGPTVETFGYFPTLERSKVVERDLACRPCSRNGARPCPKGTQECLTRVGVKNVEQAFTDLLEGTGPARYVVA